MKLFSKNFFEFFSNICLQIFISELFSRKKYFLTFFSKSLFEKNSKKFFKKIIFEENFEKKSIKIFLKKNFEKQNFQKIIFREKQKHFPKKIQPILPK